MTKVECRNCDNFDPELNSCSRIDSECEEGYISFVWPFDGCSVEEGASPISDEEYLRKWNWYFPELDIFNKYVVYRGDSIRPHEYLLGCFDSKDIAISFAALKYYEYSNHEHSIEWATQQFENIYKDNMKRVGLDYSNSDDYIYYQHIGIDEVNYYGV